MLCIIARRAGVTEAAIERRVSGEGMCTMAGVKPLASSSNNNGGVMLAIIIAISAHLLVGCIW